MPPPFSNEEYMANCSATSVCQFSAEQGLVVILTAASTGLAALKRWVAQEHQGWTIVEVNATKEVEGFTLHDQAAEGEGGLNRDAAVGAAAQLALKVGAGNTIFVINCKAGQVRSVTLAAHLMAVVSKDSASEAYRRMHFGKEQTELVKARVKAGL